MALEWDQNKNIININKHGIDFVDADKIFENPILTKIDERIDYKEKRWMCRDGPMGRLIYYQFEENI